MTEHACEICGTSLVCPQCNSSKKRPLNAQAQAVKDCLDAYVAARFEIKQPYPGTPPVGRLVQWLGQQPSRDSAVLLFVSAVNVGKQAYQLDKRWHPLPMTIPKFIDAIPKLNQDWLDGARRNAAEAKGLVPSDPVTPVTPVQRAKHEVERQRITRQTDCAAELRFNQRGADECGTKPECRDCPQRENPGSGRYRPANRGERKDGRLKPAQFKSTGNTKEVPS